MKITIIAAMDAKSGIGKDNKLPWHLPEDLAYFKQITQFSPIVMGRKTFDSIGRPLPNRHNIVLSRQPGWAYPGVAKMSSVDSIIELLNEIDNENAYIIGGAEIYSAFLPHADRMLLTELQNEYECDTFFPPFSVNEWKEINRIPATSTKNNIEYAYVEYSRIR